MLLILGACYAQHILLKCPMLLLVDCYIVVFVAVFGARDDKIVKKKDVPMPLLVACYIVIMLLFLVASISRCVWPVCILSRMSQLFAFSVLTTLATLIRLGTKQTPTYVKLLNSTLQAGKSAEKEVQT